MSIKVEMANFDKFKKSFNSLVRFSFHKLTHKRRHNYILASDDINMMV